MPVKALRDEGTSYHYAPPSRFIETNERARKAIEKTIVQHNMKYQEVITWSTDGFFRETKEKVEYRKKEGCAVVDSSGKEVTVKAEDAKLYKCNINEGDKVCLDVNNKLEKVE